MFKRILIPLDGSAGSELALEKATALALAFGAELHLARCLSSVPASDFAASADQYHEANDREAAEIQAYLGPIRERLKAQAPQVQAHQLSGPVVQNLLAFCEQREIDLIVLTSHGRSGFSRMLMGSVAEALARSAPCPVMIVRLPHPEATATS